MPWFAEDPVWRRSWELLWVGIGLARWLQTGRGPGLQLPLEWVAVAFGYGLQLQDTRPAHGATV